MRIDHTRALYCGKCEQPKVLSHELCAHPHCYKQVCPADPDTRACEICERRACQKHSGDVVRPFFDAHGVCSDCRDELFLAALEPQSELFAGVSA
jgi:hypothetical protein